MTMREVSACLDEEIIAAFVTGSLAAGEFAWVEAHLPRFDVCRALIVDAAHGLLGGTGVG
jgi:hypothetical protein